MPGKVTAHQKMPFSPALKRCEGTCSFENMPPSLMSQLKSAQLAMLSFTKVMMITSSDTTNNGPTKLCTVFKA